MFKYNNIIINNISNIVDINQKKKKNEASLSIGINFLHFYGFPYF